MLLSLKNHGLKQVLLFITDGLNSIRNACLEVFPSAKHQACWTHLCRNVMKYVCAKDKSTVMNERKLVYNAASSTEAESILYDFIVKYVCSFYYDYNQTMYRRIHKGFKECRSELEAMFM